MSSVTVPSPRLENRHGTPEVSVSTMGCKVNAFESALIREKLASAGFADSHHSGPVDIRILNTCTVTAEADRQARQQVRRMIRENPHAWVVVTGCYAQTDPEACARIPGVDLVVGNARKLDIPSLLGPMIRGELPPLIMEDVDSETRLPDQLVTGFEGRTRAFVQIQQGCDRGCTFCIIHMARGGNRSFSATMIQRQVERLVWNGYREVVLCGVDIGSYGEDSEEALGLEDLIEQLLAIPHDFRIRLSSIDPAHVNDRLIRLMSVHRDRLCPHLHLSLQSGNTLILKRMRRRATREMLLERIQALRQALPAVVLSADILVGFPTEEEIHFQETLDLVDQLEIAFPHVFSYSRRPGTPAARMPRPVSATEKKSRARRVRELGWDIRERVGKRLVGSTLPVLVEHRGKPSNTAIIGRADNYFSVRLPVSLTHSRCWQEVEVVGWGGDALIARPADERVQ